MTYKYKLAAVRQLMARNRIDAYIIPSADPHMSEYVPECYKLLQYLCGFTGSAGTLVITRNFAGLWADFRYFTQAEEQLADSGYELVKLKVQHTPEYIEWLDNQLPENATIAFDFEIFPAVIARQIEDQLKYKHLAVHHYDFISPIWQNRPALPAAKAFLLSTANSGASVADKLQAVRQQIAAVKCTVHLLSSLDDLAWLFNIRGGDVPYNPVVLSYALISLNACTLFINQAKLTADEMNLLIKQGVDVQPYEAFYLALGSLPAGTAVLLDDKRSAYAITKQLPATCRITIASNPSVALKAIKNPVEVDNMRTAMVKDGVALTRFFKWLENALPGGQVTELSAAAQVKYFRAQGEGFAGVSFASISGYQAHAALPHYTPTEATDCVIRPSGFYLLDSGGQYLYGTTDITRTIAAGPNTPEEMLDYTLVLAAMIAGSMACFPEGTRGYQVDAICRKPLWDKHRNYGHGTGHGVGYFLNVHEGPQNIGPAPAPFALETGMITSIEPGLYRPGKHGVRIENLVLTINDQVSEFGNFICFETLSICYIDTAPVLVCELSDEQRQWLNHYNTKVYNTLKSYLTEEEAEWLARKCRNI